MQAIDSIGLIGGGSIGSALGGIFQSYGKNVVYWDKDPEKSTIGSLSELIDQSALIVIGTPSWANPDIARTIAERVKDQTKLVLSVSKGVGPGFKLIPDTLSEISQDKFDWGILYGPMLAGEIKQGKYASAVLATENQQWQDCLSFASEKFHVIYSNDPKTIAMCGVLKNIYAVGLGISDGLGLGYNAKGQLTTAIFHEMKDIIKYLGGDPGQVEGPSGLGDLLATGWSGMSYNYSMGKILVEDPHKKIESEGTHSLRELVKVIPKGKFKAAEMIGAIINGEIEPREIRQLIR